MFWGTWNGSQCKLTGLIGQVQALVDPGSDDTEVTIAAALSNFSGACRLQIKGLGYSAGRAPPLCLGWLGVPKNVFKRGSYRKL